MVKSAWGPAPVPAPAEPAVLGSSIRSVASEQFPTPFVQFTSLLVTLVAKLTVIFAVGTTEPTGSGLPPTHWITMSPISSVIPSLRSWFGTATLAVQVIGPDCWFVTGPIITCADASPQHRASNAIARIVLR